MLHINLPTLHCLPCYAKRYPLGLPCLPISYQFWVALKGKEPLPCLIPNSEFRIRSLSQTLTDLYPSRISCPSAPGRARCRAVFLKQVQPGCRRLWMSRYRLKDWQTGYQLAKWGDLRCLNWRKQ